MQYDAFISYKSEDREWAQKLRNALTARGFNVYFDQERLQVAKEWPDQLRTALAESKHFVPILSSKAFQASSYVTVELGEFVHKYYVTAKENPLLPQRQIISVLLEGEPPVGLAVHGITAIRDDKRGLYAQGAAALPDEDATWKAVVERVAKTIRADDKARPVGCFVIAAQRADFEAMDFSKPTALGPTTLQAAIEKVGLDKAQFLERYGARPQSWRPFGGDTIDQTLETLKDRVNGKLKASKAKEVQGLQIRLDEPDDIVWNQDLSVVDRRDQEVARWASQPVIIVIDPLSLYIQKVVTVLNLVTSRLLSGGSATVMVLGPRKAPDVNTFLRQVLQSVANELHRVFEPELPLVQPLPLAGVNIDDEKEMQCLMIQTVANLFGSKGNAKAAMLRMRPPP